VREEPAPDDKSLAVQAHALRAAADLIENVGFPGLSLTVSTTDYSPEISIQVPEFCGSPAERTAAVARLAAAVGVTATRTQRPGLSYAWVRAAGETDGHSVCIYTCIDDASAPETAPDGES